MGRMPSDAFGGGAGLDFDTRINASTSSSSSASSLSDFPPPAAADDDVPAVAVLPVVGFFLPFFAPDFFDLDACSDSMICNYRQQKVWTTRLQKTIDVPNSIQE